MSITTTSTNKRTRIAIATIIIIGVALLALILLTGKKSDAPEHDREPTKAAAKPEGDHHDNHAAHPDSTAAHDNASITLSAEQIRSAGIVLATAGPAHVHTTTKLSGEIRLNDDRTAHVVPRLAGVVESVAANLGQQVRKGQVLAVIASPVLSEMRSELLSAQRREALAQLTFEREKNLWLDQISAEQDYLQAQQLLREAEIATRNARQKLIAIGAPATTTGALSRFELRAPFDGAIVEKHIALGEAVKEDANVFKITDLSSVWAEIAVPAGDLQTVRVGQRATVTATAMASTAKGTVSYVGALIGEQTRTAQARVTLANPGLAWRPGMFVDVAMVSGERDAAVTVRTEAIQTIDGKQTVFVKTATGFAPRVITTGASDGAVTEVLSGLAVGTAYAAQGSFVVKAEQGKGSAEHAH